MDSRSSSAHHRPLFHGAKANQEVAEAAEAVAQGFAVQLAPVLSGHQYLDIEDQALAALNDILLPGWSMLPHQRISFPDDCRLDLSTLFSACSVSP